MGRTERRIDAGPLSHKKVLNRQREPQLPTFGVLLPARPSKLVTTPKISDNVAPSTREDGFAGSITSPSTQPSVHQGANKASNYGSHKGASESTAASKASPSPRSASSGTLSASTLRDRPTILLRRSGRSYDLVSLLVDEASNSWTQLALSPPAAARGAGTEAASSPSKRQLKGSPRRGAASPSSLLSRRSVSGVASGASSDAFPVNNIAAVSSAATAATAAAALDAGTGPATAAASSSAGPRSNPLSPLMLHEPLLSFPSAASSSSVSSSISKGGRSSSSTATTASGNTGSSSKLKLPPLPPLHALLPPFASPPAPVPVIITPRSTATASAPAAASSAAAAATVGVGGNSSAYDAGAAAAAAAGAGLLVTPPFGALNSRASYSEYSSGSHLLFGATGSSSSCSCSSSSSGGAHLWPTAASFSPTSMSAFQYTPAPF